MSSDIQSVFLFFASQSHHKYKKKISGEVKDSVFFPSFFLLHKLHKPILPPYSTSVCVDYDSALTQRQSALIIMMILR
jgi:hypothetical protein